MPTKISAIGTIKVTLDKGYLRLQFPSALSRLLYGKQQFFKGLGRRDTPINREWAERIAGRIQADLSHPDSHQLFDPTLAKYLGLGINNVFKLKDLWSEFVEYKRKTGMIAETTYRTRYNRTFANYLKPYMDEMLSYDLSDRILVDLLNAGINKSNLKKLMSVLEEANVYAMNRGKINRNFFANLSEQIKPTKKSNQLIEEKDYRSYSLIERDIIIQAFRDSANPNEQRIADLVEFLFLTGCRIGEVFALRWDDMKPEWIVFDKSYSSETKITKTTKTDTIRIFRTTGYSRLEQLINRLQPSDCKSNDYVFTTIDGSQYNRFKLNALWLGVNKSRKSNEYYYPGVVTRLVQSGTLNQYLKPSSTRHTFISNQFHNGTNIKLLADSVGNSVDVIYNHYLGIDRNATIANI